MPESLSPDEVRAATVAAYPPGIGELFFELHNVTCGLQLIWQDYRALFGTSQERIELLNHSASSFFGRLDHILRHDIFLRIARLTDPPATGRHANASLAQLAGRLRPHLDTSRTAELSTKLQELEDCCAPMRDLRNRMLAHDDLDTALHFHPDPLPGISRANIESALECIRSLLNYVESLFRTSTTYYKQVIATGTAESLIAALERARKHEQCEELEFRQKYGVPPDAGAG